MPIDYSKWDNIEISDDEDIERHPNIDHASMVRWRQADIHRKRETRRFEMANLRADQKMNKALLVKLKEAKERLEKEEETAAASLTQRVHAFRATEKDVIERLKKGHEKRQAIENKVAEGIDLVQAERDLYAGPADGFPEGYMSPDEAFLSLFSQIFATLQKEGKTINATTLLQTITEQFGKIDTMNAEIDAKLAELEKEATKKLTMEDMHVAFDKTHVSKKTEPIKEKKKTQKVKETTIEVLNPKSEPGPPAEPEDSDTEEIPVPEDAAKPLLDQYAKLPTYEASYQFLQQHPSLVTPKTAEFLITKAFDVAKTGDRDACRLCIRQALTLSMGFQVGVDGVAKLFQRLMSNHGPSVELVEGNVTETFERIMKNTESARKPMTLSPAEAEANDLTPEQAAAFNSFSRPLQDAFMSGDMETMDSVISAMPKAEQDKVMTAMRSTGLLRTLEGEEIAAHERGEKLEGVMVGALHGVSLNKEE